MSCPDGACPERGRLLDSEVPSLHQSECCLPPPQPGVGGHGTPRWDPGSEVNKVLLPFQIEVVVEPESMRRYRRLRFERGELTLLALSC